MLENSEIFSVRSLIIVPIKIQCVNGLFLYNLMCFSYMNVRFGRGSYRPFLGCCQIVV